MAFACLIAYFIILTTATTLFTAGERDIQTAEQAAKALRPIAGAGASLLFGVGILGAGLLGLPALAGSTAFAIGEACRWPAASLDHSPRQAPGFYLMLAASFLVGMALNYVGIPPVRMLFIAAVINGIFAAPLLAIVCLLTADRIGDGPVPHLATAALVGSLAALLVALAALVMLLDWCGLLGSST